VFELIMYTCYHQELGDRHPHHLKLLFVDFNKACNELDKLITMTCGIFTLPFRESIKAVLDKKRTVVYFVSDDNRDTFILCDLPVIL
jgi:hypothetical protein